MDTIRGKFFKQHLLSDQFLDLIEKNKRPMDELMSYYQCAIMEVETKFKVLNQEYSLEYDRNPIEGIKTRVKSYDSILRKIRRKNIPMTLEGIEENIRDIAGVRVICSFADDVFRVEKWLKSQENYELVKEKDYISYPKPNGYRGIHLILRGMTGKTAGTYVEIQLRTIAMDFWASLEHQLKYKKEIGHAAMMSGELKQCADDIASVDLSMQTIRDIIEAEE